MGLYVYQPNANSYAGLGFSMLDNDRIVDVHYTDTPIADSWVSPVAHGFDDNPDSEGDFPSLSNYNQIPVMSERAWEALRPVIGYCCEALPIIHPTGKPFFIVHVMETVNCLDFDRSEVKRYSDGGIMRIVRYALIDERLHGKHIFKLPRGNARDLIVDGAFRNAVEASSLAGLEFNELPLVEQIVR
ncbi:MAG: hypothetical protein K2Y37_08075 [Pirellulales bacterium]|nr:hypothetical protein [Pirellulales bacterium]